MRHGISQNPDGETPNTRTAPQATSITASRIALSSRILHGHEMENITRTIRTHPVVPSACTGNSRSVRHSMSGR